MADRIDQIAADPHGPHTKPLTNLVGRRAARVGGYRIIFAVDDEARVVNISDIGPRGQVYRRI
jgi:mRNA-degrading endonuclease RelE of RelBE toxin-antitoxin system